ncbi:pentapeptide repeat protein [Herbihabitans rhizosphaerae]|uniref:Pentapeptide repeat protein n=1 Tax=Herbihabitans rhizosphaerae TaxID=1872711 RepID=A0A4Q7KLT5_9PSEU|nr:pentapeptide repeat-containing protein [Herbihabitans rhizosphaerae]RZS37628.1 pentapeptide repeat protein [Herbihabitans rhizosphaerae]
MTVDWPTCERDECIGVTVEGYSRCLAHLDDGELDAALRPGALDLRGTTVDERLFVKLFDVYTSPSGPLFGPMDLRQARFLTPVRLDGAVFHGPVDASDALFDQPVSLNGAEFEDSANFFRATFNSVADFSAARFGKLATFSHARFGDIAKFEGVEFAGGVAMVNTGFSGTLEFTDAKFHGEVIADLLRADRIAFNSATFARALRLMVDCRFLGLRQARFEDGVTLRVMRADVDATRCVFGAPSSISGAQGRTEWIPLITSLMETDVSNLSLADVDLRWCEFAGAHRLDELRMDGLCPLNTPPKSWRRARRWVLAEEHYWRGWPTDERANPRVYPIDPLRIAGLYRSLRKAFEDGKNEPGAGDFYYGEMEMRRHAPSTPWFERTILAAYWALSGYGQRASRAIVALVVLLATVTVLLMGFGLSAPAQQQITGTVHNGQAQLAVREPATALPDRRWTWDRAGKALQTSAGAMVFRDSGQKLTYAGTWILMLARFGGPLLLALAVLAVRARVKR